MDKLCSNLRYLDWMWAYLAIKDSQFSSMSSYHVMIIHAQEAWKMYKILFLHSELCNITFCLYLKSPWEENQMFVTFIIDYQNWIKIINKNDATSSYNRQIQSTFLTGN